jgi:choline kinase
VSVAISRAVVLAAGNGDRFNNGRNSSKLLHPVLGEPLIHRTLRSASAAGITAVTIVLGYRADEVRQAVHATAPAGLHISYAHNPDWHLENGTSVLAARPFQRTARFALLMGDHLFEPASLQRVLNTRIDRDNLLLAVDRHPSADVAAYEATKVRLRDGRITAIGKTVDPYDALDTGMFVCGESVFDALTEAAAAGDTTLTGGVRVLAARGLACAFDINGAYWQDVDTMDDLQAAETALASGSNHR